VLATAERKRKSQRALQQRGNLVLITLNCFLKQNQP